MKIAMTLVVRDEADIVGEQIRYHLENGVDVVVATDNGSVDGTTEILHRYERCLHLFREPGDLQQEEWVTRMAHYASEELRADWVINSDADEFLWPRRGSIRETLEAVPAGYGAVRALVRNFVPRPAGQGPPTEWMTIRHPSVPARDHLCHAQVSVVHRGRPGLRVPRGNHDAYGADLALLREWFPFEVFHFPVRSVGQMATKFSRRRDRPAAFVAAMRRAIAAEGVEAVFGRYLVDDARLARGLAAGELAVDVRLRDALRAARLVDLASEPDPYPPESAVEAERAFVADIAAFMETDAAVDLRRRLEALEARTATVPRAGRPLQRAVERVRRAFR